MQIDVFQVFATVSSYWKHLGHSSLSLAHATTMNPHLVASQTTTLVGKGGDNKGLRDMLENSFHPSKPHDVAGYVCHPSPLFDTRDVESTDDSLLCRWELPSREGRDALFVALQKFCAYVQSACPRISVCFATEKITEGSGSEGKSAVFELVQVYSNRLALSHALREVSARARRRV